MKLVRVECSFDGSKILFFFTADGRVDFRELVKDLALSLLLPRPALGRVKNTIDVLFDNAVFLHLLFRLAVILIQFAFSVV